MLIRCHYWLALILWSDNHIGDALSLNSNHLQPACSPSNRLLELIEESRQSASVPRAIPLFGVHDALSANILVQQGAPALFVSGFGISASRLCQPDARLEILSCLSTIVMTTTAAERFPL